MNFIRSRLGLGALPSLVVLLALHAAGHLTAQDSQADAERDYSAELHRFPPRSPQEAMESFRLLDGFEIELVAAEPLVVDPVAFAFDARSRLFVIEMRDYSEQATENLGRLALLEDRDGDGRMDHRSTFVDKLSWPTAVWPWRDGALVAEPPNLTWYRDTNDDGVSDAQETWFVGFSRSNVQGMVNSLRWGVDCFIHGATSSAGAELELLEAPAASHLTLRRSDFAIDPLAKTLRPTSGGGQHGLSFNRWGDKFVTSNSDHLQQIIDLESWLAEHPARVTMPPLRRSIAEDGPQAEVFRTSPVEPWRIVRTRLRVGGIVPGPIEGGGRAAGYFTGATGTWIMDAGAGFVDSEHDAALVCDVGSNLVHRKILVDEGLFWTGRRVDPQTELLTSSDTWFRPVQLGDGPDGNLYIADMYREVIEHPKSLPPVIKKHLDLTSGRDRGRIWRLVSSNADWTAGSQVDLASASVKEWIDLLDSPIAWQRRMASQLLVERGLSGQQGLLWEFFEASQRPEAKIIAMHVASRLDLFDSQWSSLGLKQEHPRVLEHAIRLTRENQLHSEQVRELSGLVSRTEPRIQLELAQAAAELPEAARLQILKPILKTAERPLVRSVVAITASESWKLFAGEPLKSVQDEAYKAWLDLMLPIWAGQVGQDPELASWMASQLVVEEEGRRESWLDAVAGLNSQAEVRGILGVLTDEQEKELSEFVQVALAEHPRSAHAGWLRLTPQEVQRKWFKEWLTPNQSETVQSEALRVLDASDHPATAELLLARFRAMTPNVQSQALRLLLQRPDAVSALLNAIEKGQVRVAEIPPEQRQRIQSISSSEVQRKARKLFGATTEDRAKLVAEYASALKGPVEEASLVRGRAYFEKACAQCHQLDGIGNNVGAPLKQLNEKSPHQLLEAILDPNREVDPRFISYSVLLDDDRAVAGVIEQETANQLVLVEAGGKRNIIPRERILQLKSSGTSLMPVGLEQQLTPVQMYELICFLRQDR